MKQSFDERVKDLKKQLDERPSMCKCCKLKTHNGKAEYVCGKTERVTFFGVKTEKCYGDCNLYEKDFPEMFKDSIFSALKSAISKLEAEPKKLETTDAEEAWEIGYYQCTKDVLKTIDELSK